MDASGSNAADPFVIRREFDAPRARVFKAWTDRADLMRWWGPKGFTLRSCTIDLRPGGVFHYELQTPDGSSMWGRWVFREIVAPERLVVVTSFSDEAGGVTRHPMAPEWPLEMVATTTFTEQNGRTLLTLRWAPLNPTEAERRAFAAGRDSMQQGWTGTLDQLAEHLEQPREQAMLHLNPYLAFDGRCEEAFRFYAQSLGGKIAMMMTYGESPMAEQTPAELRGKIMHARLTVGDKVLMGSDAPPHMFAEPKGFHVSVVVDDPAEAERMFNALAEGGTIQMSLGETFWAQRFGMLVDRFGIPWMVNCEKPATA